MINYTNTDITHISISLCVLRQFVIHHGA